MASIELNQIFMQLLIGFKTNKNNYYKQFMAF